MKRIVVILMVLVALFAVTAAQAQEAVGYNEPVTGEFTESEFEFNYTFTGSEGDVVVVLVDPVDPLGDVSDSIIIVTDPSGSVVVDTTDAFSFGSSLAALELTESGDYTVTVTRADGEAGESLGEFNLEVVQAQPLAIGEVVTATTDSDTRNQYYYVNVAEEFGVSFNKTAGDFYPQLTVNTLDSTDYGLDEVATAAGGEMEGAVLFSFDPDMTYVVSVGEALFDFNFETVTADYELELITAGE